MATIVHFEIPAEDVDRARRFYSGLFGWQIEKAPQSEYWLVTTSGEKQVGGGIMKRQDPQQGITNYIDVPSVDEFAKKALKLGGRVLLSRKAVPGMGYFAVCQDPEGNSFGLWEDDREAR